MKSYALAHHVDGFSYRQEVARKLLHLSSLWIPVAIYYLDQTQITVLLGFTLMAMLTFEVLRMQQHLVARLLHRLFNPIIRAAEKAPGIQLTGATYMIAAALLICLLFPKPIAITSLSIMLISDSAAALIGKIFGRTRIMDKSLEGSAAFLLTALVTVIAISFLAGFHHRFMVAGLFASITATAVELFSSTFQLDDNLTIPLTAALTMLLIIDSF